MPLFLTAINIQFFDECIALFISLLGFGLFAAAFLAGGAVTSFLENFLTDITDRLHFNLSPTFVNVLTKGLIAAAALLLAAPAMPSFSAVVDTMMPIGDFNEITGEFAAAEGKFLINVFFQVLLEQTALSFAYFIPFILVDLFASIIRFFLCRRDEYSGIAASVISFFLDIFTLYAVNALVLASGTFFMELMYGFLQTIDISHGVLRFLALLVIFVIMFFFVLRDLLTSDILVAVLGMNISAALMNITIGSHNRWYIFVITIVCGLLARLYSAIFGSEPDDFTHDAFHAIATLVGTALVFALVFAIGG